MKTKKDLQRGVDYIGITCVFYCHDGKGNFLMHKRSKNCRDEIGNWDLGGGSMEFGETFEEAALREIKEEYCCDVLELEYLGAYNALRRHRNKPTHWVAMLFAAKVDPNQAQIGEPDYMDEMGWFTKDTMPEPLHTGCAKAFPLIIGKLSNSSR